jgi:hypothetical protein
MPGWALSRRIVLPGAVPLFSCAVAASSRPGPLPYTGNTPYASQQPSPRGSAARGSCGTRNALCSVRSRVSTSCSIVLSRLRSATSCFNRLFSSCHHQKNPAGMPLAGPIPGRVNDRPSDGAPRASELFSQHLLHRKALLLHAKSPFRFCRRLTFLLAQNYRARSVSVPLSQ